MSASPTHPRLLTPPPPWSTGVQGSFAHHSLAVRMPKILEDTIAENAGVFPAAVVEACERFLGELRTGTLRGLKEDAPDREAWDAACRPLLGRSWLDLPWYFAESFFYRRILEAVDYFGARRGIDPFLTIKHREEAAMMPRVGAVQQALQGAVFPLIDALHASLWGNRADLSYAVGRAFGDVGTDDDLLVNDTQRVIDVLTRARRVAIVLDNAGTELAFDLLLADVLERMGIHVVLCAKAHPFFVSDATPADVERTRLLLDVPALPVTAHPHMTSSRFLRTEAMPDDLVAFFSEQDLVVSKGDANYRRLVADAPWPHDTPADAALSFPAPVLALRTCKAEVLVGVPREITERARARDPNWLINGHFGLIQLVP